MAGVPTAQEARRRRARQDEGCARIEVLVLGVKRAWGRRQTPP